MASSREEEYLKALDIAKSTFLSHDSKERCRIAGAEWELHAPGGIVRLPFFKDLCRITLPAFEFSFQENQPSITLANQILILHYLNGVKDIALAKKPFSFDATIPEFLSTEDIAVIAQEVMLRMIKLHYSHHKN